MLTIAPKTRGVLAVVLTYTDDDGVAQVIDTATLHATVTDPKGYLVQADATFNFIAAGRYELDFDEAWTTRTDGNALLGLFHIEVVALFNDNQFSNQYPVTVAW